MAGCCSSPCTTTPPSSSRAADTPQPSPQKGHVVRTASMCGPSAPAGQLQIDNAAFHFDGMGSRAAFVGRDRAAAVQFDAPVVQRTRDTENKHETKRQRTTNVRTTIVEREHMIVRRAK